MNRRRARGSLEDPTRINLLIEGASNARLDEIAHAVGTTRSAVVQWLIDRIDVDEQGVPTRWYDDHPREELLPLGKTA